MAFCAEDLFYFCLEIVLSEKTLPPNFSIAPPKNSIPAMCLYKVKHKRSKQIDSIVWNYDFQKRQEGSHRAKISNRPR